MWASLISPVVNSITGAGKVFFGDKAEKQKQTFNLAMQKDKNNLTALQGAQAQFAAEFAYPPRTLFDSFINGINRLPRPLMAIGVFSMFVYCMVDPDGFKESATALKEIPLEMWILFKIIVLFYFGGRWCMDYIKGKQAALALASVANMAEPKAKAKPKKKPKKPLHR